MFTASQVFSLMLFTKKNAGSPSRTAPQPPVCSNLALHYTTNYWLNWRGIGGTTIGDATLRWQTTQENTCELLIFSEVVKFFTTLCPLQMTARRQRSAPCRCTSWPPGARAPPSSPSCSHTTPGSSSGELGLAENWSRDRTAPLWLVSSAASSPSSPLTPTTRWRTGELWLVDHNALIGCQAPAQRQAPAQGLVPVQLQRRQLGQEVPWLYPQPKYDSFNIVHSIIISIVVIISIIVIFREPLRGVGAAQPAAARRVRGTRRERGRQQTLLRSGVRKRSLW